VIRVPIASFPLPPEAGRSEDCVGMWGDSWVEIRDGLVATTGRGRTLLLSRASFSIRPPLPSSYITLK